MCVTKERWSKSIAVPSFNSWMRRVKAGAFFLSKDATCTISSCVTYSSNAVARGHSWSDIHSAVFQYNTKLNFSNHWRGFSHQSTTHCLQAEICDPICLCTDHSDNTHNSIYLCINYRLTYDLQYPSIMPHQETLETENLRATSSSTVSLSHSPAIPA